MNKPLSNMQLLRALGEVDDRFISDAMECKSKRKVTALSRRTLIASIAALLIALIGGYFITKNYSNRSETINILSDSYDKAEETRIIQDSSIEIAEVITEETTGGTLVEQFVPNNADQSIDLPISIILPDELSTSSTEDYEYSSDVFRMSYFDEAGDLLLEIERSSISLDTSFLENYESYIVSQDVTLYLDGDVYVGATIMKDEYSYIIRTPMGVSENTIMEIISQL